MMSPVSVRAYSTGAMVLHWAIALLILAQIVAGFVMANTEILTAATRFSVIQWHKTIGIAVLALTLARIAWRLMHRPPDHPPMRRAERLAAHAVHGAFYVLMLALPLTGWLLISSSRKVVPTLLFLQSALPWPALPVGASRAALHEAAEGAHATLAYLFAALIVLHVAGALKHALVDRVPSLTRMLPIGRLQRMPGTWSGAMLAVLVSLGFLGGGVWTARSGAATAPAAAATPIPAQAGSPSGWIVDKAASSLAYDIDFSGAPVQGAIGQWSAAIVFDPQALASASATLTIDAASITYANDFVAPSIAGDDGLQAAAHPQLTVVLDRFTRTDGGFLAAGTARIRDLALPVEVPFSFAADAATGRASAEGTATLDRLAFGLGRASDAGAEWLGRTIRVRFRFEATPAQPGR